MHGFEVLPGFQALTFLRCKRPWSFQAPWLDLSRKHLNLNRYNSYGALKRIRRRCDIYLNTYIYICLKKLHIYIIDLFFMYYICYIYTYVMFVKRRSLSSSNWQMWCSLLAARRMPCSSLAPRCTSLGSRKGSTRCLCRSSKQVSYAAMSCLILMRVSYDVIIFHTVILFHIM